jgi:heptosyltransferase-1
VFARASEIKDLNREVKATLPFDGGIEAEAVSLAGPLDVSRPFVILNPGAGWGAKQWPAERYAKVARVLGDEGYQSLVNFGPGEEELAKIVVAEGGGHAFCAQLSVLELTAIARRARLYIGGDTGPTHLAAMLRLPVVAIFGPTDPARNGPYGTKCVVLRDPSSVTSHKRVRETEPGLLSISTDQVLDAARELLRANQEGARA